MNRAMHWTALAAAVLALSAPARAQQVDADKDADALIEAWPESTMTSARMLIDRYGPPDSVTDRRLSWVDQEPWSRITLQREGPTANFPTTHQNTLEHTVRYRVPDEKAGELVKFDPSLTVDREAGTLSARSDSEAANILALNLADEIVDGKKSVDEARATMRNELRKRRAGKSSPYCERLMFDVDAPRD
jgi:hypothetical protein